MTTHRRNIDAHGVPENPNGAVERIVPGSVDPDLEAEHRARYAWAARQVGGLRVLDVATGTGYGTPLLQSGGARSVYAVDSSLSALHVDRDNYDAVMVCADAHTLPFTELSIDVVVSLETIEHLIDPRTFLREIHRVLRRDGELLLTTPNAALSDGMNPFHLKEFLFGELEDELRDAGFKLTKRAGQHWRLRSAAARKVRGLRRLAFEIERRPEVRSMRLLPASPLVWCLIAEKSSN